ncbi:MAG: translation initiation factor IF-2 [Ignavibacteriales bacterium CG_4_9_14_3_um_filter_30_11]|nr:MAG: translation initiation factor IF-2 [Ignavibacteriales bacterium CG_4_9_14_3_um_filter_30_11]
MAETKPKKIKIFKFASENNLSAKELLEFLTKKGYKVKTIMSTLEDEMIEEIANHYKKDIDKAQKHYKKIAEFKKEKTDKEVEVSVAEPVEVVEDKKPKVEEIKEEEVPTKKEKDTEEKEVEEIKEEEKFKTPAENAIAKRKGLTVVGKMNLDETKTKKTTTKVEEEVTESKDAKGKKKKRLKGKKKTTQVEDELKPAKKKKRIKKFEINEKDVKAAIRKTMLSIDDTTTAASRASHRKKKRKEREEEEEKKQEQKSIEASIIKVTEYSAVNELANLMEIPVSDVIAKCMELGIMVSINQRLDVETITLVADEFGFEVEFVQEFTSDVLTDTSDELESIEPRSPVVTIMGHVDHGKTSLLDYIRKENVVSGESGGITQHIGAYKVDAGKGKHITFLDTPGHEAFTAMRARGAQATDIVVLIVAADDAVMPQTIEAINHAQAANVPIVIAINKIDKPGANSEKIKQQLADRNILVESWGGKYQCVEISAKTGLNIETLLETILLEAELLELKANPNRKARGILVESQLDKGRGITGTVLVQKGTLKIGDPFVAGIFQGKVRAMFDERGKKLIQAPPSTPVQVLGFEGAPQAGDTFIVVDSERHAREVGLKRQQLKREQDQKQVHHITLDEIAKQISIGGVKELPLIVKGDVDGSIEALSDSLMKLSTEEVKVRVIHKGVGGISEGDVLLASASNAIIIGFHVRPNLNARKLAEKENVDIRLYNVIYDTINEVKSALEGLLSPIISEEVTSTVEVRDIFKVPKVGTVAGCYVLEGKVTRNNKIRLIRDGIVIHQGEINALKRFKDDVKEVDAGYECGLSINNFNDIKVNDIVETYKMVETKKKLS